MDEIRERYSLAKERIAQIRQEETVKEPFLGYFRKMADWMDKIAYLYEQVREGVYYKLPIEELKMWNKICYGALDLDNYRNSYLNPAYAIEELGLDYGKLMTFLRAELLGTVRCSIENRVDLLVLYMELFIEIYNCFEEEIPAYSKVRNILYWFVRDYCDVFIPEDTKAQYIPENNHVMKLVMESNLQDLRYLYWFGRPVTEQILQTAQNYLTFSQKEIEWKAEEILQKILESIDISSNIEEKERSTQKIKTIAVYYPLGCERLFRLLIQKLQKNGIAPIPYQGEWSRLDRELRVFHYDIFEKVNPQYFFDHQYDEGLLFDKALAERKQSVLRVIYEEEKDWLSAFAGVVVIEPENKQKIEIPKDMLKAEELTEQAPKIQFYERQQKMREQMQKIVWDLQKQYILKKEIPCMRFYCPVPQSEMPFDKMISLGKKIRKYDESL